MGKLLHCENFELYSTFHAENSDIHPFAPNGITDLDRLLGQYDAMGTGTLNDERVK